MGTNLEADFTSIEDAKPLSMSELAFRAREDATSAALELNASAAYGIKNTDEERKCIARALAEFKDAIVCLEALLARL